MSGGHHVRAAAFALESIGAFARVSATLALVLAIAGACGGKKPAADAGTSTSGSASIRGLPNPNSEDWCEPMPDLGAACTEDLKECAIVCDYISDTCALLVCLSGTWEYVERGGTSEAE